MFGSPEYVRIAEEKRKKLDFKAQKCILVGYGELQGVKGYHLYNKTHRKYLINRDVIFDEISLLKQQHNHSHDTNGLKTINNNLIQSGGVYEIYNEVEIPQQHHIFQPIQHSIAPNLTTLPNL
jgi:hypothetical protein